MNCHQCKHNGMESEACLSCAIDDEYSFKYQKYLFETYDAPQQETDICSTNRATNLSEEDEDKLRRAMFEMFRLQPLELLMLQAIMQKKTLTQFAKDIEALAKKNQTCTRFHAFQLRKSLLAKIPSFADALITEGQRKPLKKTKVVNSF